VVAGNYFETFLSSSLLFESEILSLPWKGKQFFCT